MVERTAEPASPGTAALEASQRPPPAERDLLNRPRISRLLDKTTAQPLTLVVAPAGTGKTAALAAWASASERSTHWLSFEDVRGDHRAIILAFVESIASMYPDLGQRAFTVIEQNESLEDAVRPLIEDLAALRRTPSSPVVLVIDDLHRVDHDTDLLTALTLLVSHLPQWLRIVLASRREPPLPLDRLRARGLVGEVRYPELRLSDDEATEVLSLLDPSMADDKVSAVVAKADGWAAYLQMAALASRSAGARSRRDSDDPDPLIEDYIWNEILGDEAPRLVCALQMLAVAPRVNPGLATALLEDPQSPAALSAAEQRGLFVYRTVGRWYEIQPIIRDILQAELARRDPSSFETQQVRLARWYEEEGDIAGGIAQWLAAGRPRDALRLLALSHSTLYDDGRESTVAAALASIPPHIVAGDPQATLDLAWCHVLVDRRRFIELTERATWWARSEPFEPRIAARLAILRSIAATVQGDHTAGGALAREALEQFGPNWWGDPLGRFAWNMVAREVALDERWDDSSDEVRRLDLELGRDPHRRLAFEGTRALGVALSGHPVDALRYAAGVRRAAEVANMTILRSELHLAEAIALREIGDRQRAVRLLEDIAATPAETMLFCRVLASIDLVHAHLDRNDRPAARAALVQAQQLIESESFRQVGTERLAAAAVRLALSEGDADLARQRAASMADTFWAPLSMARVHLALGEERLARRLLAAAKPRGARHRVLLATLWSRSVDTTDETTRWATEAVEIAIANGLLQTIAAEGIETIEHLESAAWPAPEEWFGRVRRAAADAGGRSPSVRIDLVEPLTDREWDVIRYLPSRLTVREIAAELYVSVNTLKSHMKAVYRKLGVSSRQEAAGVARTMLAARRHTGGRSDNSSSR